MADSLPPPNSGTYDYNAFIPGAVGAAGQYVDPVHGATVRRVTVDHGRDDIYGRNMMWSADETRYLHRTQGVVGKSDAWDVVDVQTGQITHTGIPFGSIASDGGFDPILPNVLYSLSGRNINKITLQANGTWTSVVYFTAPSDLMDLGGSINWMDRRGRFMLVRYGTEPSVYLYDRRNLAAGPYANPIDASNTIEQGSYLGLTPSGRYVVGFDSRAIGFAGVGQGVSWRRRGGSFSLDPEPTTFWSVCGDHGAFASTTDNRDYFISYDCYSHAGLWRIDITNDATGLSDAQQEALPGNQLLLPFSFSDFGHVASIAKGPRRDWVYIATEDSTDLIGGSTTPWHAYRNEIIAVNILSGQVWRAAHHRSRSIGGDYYRQPRISCSWNGSTIGWASNFNDASNVDIYAIMLTPIVV